MLVDDLKHFFGFDEFKPGQEDVINSIVAHQNTLGILPTGSGKSLCYQLPTYINQKPTLIISPLISLMDDQVMQMRMHGEHQVVAIHSGLDDSERRSAFRNISSARFIFVSPEFILLPQNFKKIKSIQFGLIVLDEVHCLSEWGFDFRPHYIRIGEITNYFKATPILALTATATVNLKDDLEKVTNQTFKMIELSMDRPNISLSVQQLSSYDDKVARLLSLIEFSGPTIVYVSSKKVCLDLAENIYASGFLTGIYHADLSYQERNTVQQQFLANEIPIVVATSAFGMGINKPDVRTVIHFHLPSNPSSYIQEIGRAGRDNKQSQAIALFQPDDRFLMETLATGNLVTPSDVQLFQEGILLNQDKQVIIEELKHVFSLNQLKTLFDNHLQLRTKAYQYMMNFVLTKQCRRATLLHYFKTTPKTASQCCDSCEAIDVLTIKNRKKVKRQMDYKEKLASLFE
ncbi:RecQ family ATP-dependent DNA helicase [Staphylococcus felis]|uniref:RecQ family ATP-dependent DNA helicase n=1 Tax=Staphylococcus felis TaxID=46127 RepID=UPI000E2373C9|nr:RecQ family ATP-dependent DNA helicase [Staphylococcus felis]REH78325.1 recombinase RecQ [Staphylococcus felis]REI31051.1 recombinase RecQ [Staphylococcus felis]